jgi:hypothetical protein
MVAIGSKAAADAATAVADFASRRVTPRRALEGAHFVARCMRRNAREHHCRCALRDTVDRRSLVTTHEFGLNGGERWNEEPRSTVRRELSARAISRFQSAGYRSYLLRNSQIVISPAARGQDAHRTTTLSSDPSSVYKWRTRAMRGAWPWPFAHSIAGGPHRARAVKKADPIPNGRGMITSRT